MNRTARIVLGIIAIVASLGSAVCSVTWFINGRTKHGLLFAAIFVVLFLLGLILARAKGAAAKTPA